MYKKIVTFSFIYISLLLIVAGVISTINNSDSISDKVLRFHILANSDSKQDQELKLKVRDAILEYSKDKYNDCNGVNDAILVAEGNIDNYNIIAQEVIENNGYDYSVSTNVVKEYYDTRIYDNFTLPAGIYDSLKIEIGEGKGHNWWCVVYPTVCLSGCTDDFDNCLSQEEKEFILNDKYIIKFKIVEIYEKLKLYIKKEA